MFILILLCHVWMLVTCFISITIFDSTIYYTKERNNKEKAFVSRQSILLHALFSPTWRPVYKLSVALKEVRQKHISIFYTEIADDTI